MSDERIPKCKLDLNLYLGFPQKQDLDEDQSQLVSHQQQDPVEEQGQDQITLQQNIQPSLTSPHHMTSPIQNNGGQFLPPQAEMVENTIAEPSYKGCKRLRLRQEQDSDEDQGELVRHHQQNSVEEHIQRQFMELSGSALQQNIQLPLTSPHRMTSPIQSYGNYQPVMNVPAQPPNFSSPYQSSEQGQLFPTQAVTDRGETSLPLVTDETTIAEPSHRGRKRSISCVDDIEIKPPYPWATNRPATIKSRRDLSLENINVITGKVKCKSCDKEQTLEYNLEDKFSELCQFITKEKKQMRRQSPKSWMHPKRPLCMTCNSEMKPDICTDRKNINWLFLLLGQMLGCCTLEDLKFFCKWNTQHCTASKDRVLYLTYLALCKQLEPNEPFDP